MGSASDYRTSDSSTAYQTSFTSTLSLSLLRPLNYLLGLSGDQVPHSLSTSYADFEPTVPTDYQEETCDLFSQLGAKGVSIFVASGDNGVGSNCANGKYVPMYSSDRSWITSVGGTVARAPRVLGPSLVAASRMFSLSLNGKSSSKLVDTEQHGQQPKLQ